MEAIASSVAEAGARSDGRGGRAVGMDGDGRESPMGRGDASVATPRRDGRDGDDGDDGDARRPSYPSSPSTTVSGWLASLWDVLLAEDGDEWADARRGRGGTPTGARALRNVELGVEQEMEVVLRTTGGGGGGGRASSLGTTAARRRRRWRRSASGGGGGGGGYFFGDDDEAENEAADDDGEVSSSSSSSSSSESESEVTSAPRRSEHLPNVFPGQKVRALGPAKTDARAAEMQRLWGNPSAYVTADECRDVVRSLREADVVRRAMDERLKRWAARVDARDVDGDALGADDLLEFWRRRCVTLCDVFLEALERVGGRFESCSTTPRHRESLRIVVEGYVSGGVRETLLREGVFPVYADEDARARARLRRIATLPLDALGLHVERHGAIVHDDACARSMASLEDATCPAHVARLLVDVLSRAREVSSTTDHPLDADDELVVLLVLLARADLERPHSLAMYVDTFLGLVSSARKGEGGFAAATLCGATRYARSDAMRDILDAREASKESGLGR